MLALRFLTGLVSVVSARRAQTLGGTLDFVYTDKVARTAASPHIPLGEAALKIHAIYEVTRITTGFAGHFGGHHSQLLVQFEGDSKSMLAVDLHTVRDPKNEDKRLDLGRVTILRVPWEDPETSKTQNSAVTMTRGEQRKAKEDNPKFSPKSIYRKKHFSVESGGEKQFSERELFSALRVFDKLYAHRYGMLTFNCQVMISMLWRYFTGSDKLGCLDCHLFDLPSDAEFQNWMNLVHEREDALDKRTVEHRDGELVDTIDELDLSTCQFRERIADVPAFPVPRSLPLRTHEILGGGGTSALFRAYSLGLHHIGSTFELSDRPLVFRGNLKYAKRAFTAAQHELIHHNKSSAATAVEVGPLKLGADIGGAFFRYLLNFPGHTEEDTTVNSIDDFLRAIDYGRRIVVGQDGARSYSGRQRFTYALTDQVLFLATGGMTDSMTIPLGATKVLKKNVVFDTLSKHNMHAGARNYVRYAGEFVVINLDRSNDDTSTWRETDRYELIFDNGSGSFAPPFPEPLFEGLLKCNLPPSSKISIRHIRSNFMANREELSTYCDYFGGSDITPPAEKCKKSMPFARADKDEHLCCGRASKEGASCSWTWPASVSSDCVLLDGACCQQEVVGSSGQCATEMCSAGLAPKKRPDALWNKLEGLAGLATTALQKKDFECEARQWRTRMFDCTRGHQVGSPASNRTTAWLAHLKEFFEQNGLLKQWEAYLESVSGGNDNQILLEHLQHGPRNLDSDWHPGDDKDVVQCVLPFINNGFRRVPMAMKLSQFMKDGVYDPAEGEVRAAKLHKLEEQYQQYIFGTLDYKSEAYKTGFDGEDGCPNAITIGRAVDEWGNAKASASEPSSGQLSVEIAREDWEELSLMQDWGTYSVSCGGLLHLNAPISGESFTLSGAMVLRVGDEDVSSKSPDEVRGLIERQLKSSSTVTVRLHRGPDPSLCSRLGSSTRDRA